MIKKLIFYIIHTYNNYRYRKYTVSLLYNNHPDNSYLCYGVVNYPPPHYGKYTWSLRQGNGELIVVPYFEIGRIKL